MVLLQKTSAFWLLLFACFITLVYSNHFENSFHFDDTHSIQDNPWIENLSNIPRFFQDRTTSSSLTSHQGYRPLVTTSLALDYALGGGLSPFAFHLSNFLGFLSVSLLIFPLFQKLLLKSEGNPQRVRLFSLAAVIFFGMHAANAETVNYIIARSDILVALAQMLSFVMYLRGGLARKFFLLPAVTGLFAKESGIMIVPTFLAYFFLFEEQGSLPRLFTSEAMKKITRSFARGLPLIAICSVTYWFTINSGQYRPGGESSKLYAMTQPFVILLYTKHFFCPIGLSADTDLPLVTSVLDWRFGMGIFFLLVLLGTIVILSSFSRTKAAAFGLIWYLLTLLPTSSFIPLAEPMNDHRTFLSYVGLLLAITNLLEVAREKRISGRILTVCFLPLLFGNVVLLRQRNEVWKTEESLWKDVTEKSPRNGRGWMNYGITQMLAGRYEEAKAALEKARALTPTYSTLWINLGVLHSSMGFPMQAEEAFLLALRLGKDEVEPHLFYAGFLQNMGRYRESELMGRQALLLFPEHLGARLLLLETFFRAHKSEEFRTLLKETENLFPHNQRLSEFSTNHSLQELISEEAPRFSNIELLKQSQAEYRRGEFQESIATSLTALQTPSQHGEAYKNICAANFMLKQFDEAKSACNLAVRANPGLESEVTQLRRLALANL